MRRRSYSKPSSRRRLGVALTSPSRGGNRPERGARHLYGRVTRTSRPSPLPAANRVGLWERGSRLGLAKWVLWNGRVSLRQKLAVPAVHSGPGSRSLRRTDPYLSLSRLLRLKRQEMRGLPGGQEDGGGLAGRGVAALLRDVLRDLLRVGRSGRLESSALLDVGDVESYRTWQQMQRQGCRRSHSSEPAVLL
jgi:hypothetical protein